MQLSRNLILAISGVLLLVAAFSFIFYKTQLGNKLPQINSAQNTVLGTNGTWRQVVEGWNLQSDGCEVRTARVVLPSVVADRNTLVFEYIHCGPEAEQFRSTQDLILSKASYPPLPGEVVEEDSYIQYWALDATEDTEDFIEGLIATQPTANAREHCVVTRHSGNHPYLYGPEEQIYSVTPDEYLLEKTQKAGFDYDDTCAQYGAVLSIRFFKRVENVLFLISVGQDSVGEVDVGSFRLE